MAAFDIRRGIAVLFVAAVGLPARAAEHVILKNGFAVDCARREVVGDKVRLYLAQAPGAEGNYLEVASDAVARVEAVADAPVPQGLKPHSFGPVDGVAEATPLQSANAPSLQNGNAVSIQNSNVVSIQSSHAFLQNRATSQRGALLSREEMHTMLARAGDAHNIDEDLLASVVRAESGGQVRAVSRTGARGLMQLMPKTATKLGVTDSFQPEENVAGGSTYLDQLLTRYHDNVALALAAYNAGPAAVDRYHGIPPYRETQAYVARVIREFNRRKKMARVEVARSR